MSEGISLTAQMMKKALTRLDELLVLAPSVGPVELIVGGGGAMILAHGFPLATSDIDAVPRGMSLDVLAPFITQIAKEQSISHDWLNPYYATFAHTLPSNYGERLIEVFHGKKLKALALSKEEMLIMKCFAHRAKDARHAIALIQAGANIPLVEKHIESLIKKNIPGAQVALDFLDDIRDQV